MQLIYLYIDEYCNFQQEEFNFSPEVHLHFDPETYTVIVSDTQFQLPESFWGENINNLTAVVGNNGAGKTSLMQYILEFFLYAYRYEESNQHGILIFGEGNKLYEYCNAGWANQFAKIRLKSSKYRKIQYLRQFDTENILGRTKLIYLTNILSIRDSRRGWQCPSNRTAPLYDCSVGNVLVSDTEKDANQIYRDGSSAAAVLESYFLYEQYKQIKFMFDKRQHKTCIDLQAAGYPVPVPKRLYIDLILTNLSTFALNSSVFVDHWGHNCADEVDQILFPDLYILRKSANLVQYDAHTHLRRELSRCTIWCAIKSAVTLMDDGDQYIFCDFLQDLIHQEEHPNNYIALFQTIWSGIQVSKKKGQNQREAWESLDSCRGCYIDFLEFIESEPLEEHFQIETYKCYTRSVDSSLETITFSIDTTDEWFMEFIQKYRYICNPDYFLDFQWNLSSGENSLLSLFASLYYIYEADYTNPKNGEYQIWNLSEQGRRTQCDSVILLFDEADLTYHPEWQRMFIDLLTAFLPKLYPPMCCQDIQIILTTHSPVLLSDIPQQSVIYLKYDPESHRTRVDSSTQEGTFGQNIHLLYKSSFFLENGTIGRFAQRKIKSIVEELHDIEENPEKFSPGNLSERLEYQLRPCAELIAEPIIRRRVLAWIDVLEKKLSPEKGDSRFRNMSDNELKQELDRLQKELRRRKHD